MSSKKENYYAVARGRQPGVYLTWPEAQKQVAGFQNARYKKFPTSEEAKKFIKDNAFGSFTPMGGFASKNATKGLQSISATSKVITKAKAPKPKSVETSLNVEHGPVVYTDGACSNNGRKSAKAGYGVFWGEDHPLNVSARVEGAQTNNRAEYMAVITALKQGIEQGHKKMTIRTDSELLVRTVTLWIPTWRRKNWVKADGQQVLNLDLVQELDRLISSKQINAKFEHVAGHAGIHGNEMADMLAVHGANASIKRKSTDRGEEDEDET